MRKNCRPPIDIKLSDAEKRILAEMAEQLELHARERQRIALLRRGVASGPIETILDEITAGMAPEQRRKLLGLAYLDLLARSGRPTSPPP